jgi:AcrR family transcriptional regulator
VIGVDTMRMRISRRREVRASERGRRRGDALEAAIVDAAWAELLEQGYAGFTMEGVAQRAGTSRPVLARRWESKADLVVAAIKNYNIKNPVEVPDLGNVRAELILLLQKFSDFGAGTMMKVFLSMNDYFAETETSISELRERVIGKSQLQEVLKRGIARGELDPVKLTPRIASLPADLLRHDMLMTHKPVSRAAIVEILDTIFLPLVTRVKTR